MKFLHFVVFMCTCCYTIAAQDCSYSLKGKVLDFHDQKPLSGATIVLIKLNKSVISDVNGNFVFTGLCNGIYELEIAHPECISRVVPIRIEGNTTEKISLEHHLEELGEVTVTGAKNDIIAKTVNAQTITTATIEQYTAASIGDALKEISGVSSLNTGSTIVKPIIQGLNSSRILLITNDIRLQDQEWGIEHAPNVDLNTAEKLTVVKGSGALQYGGDAIGGIVLAQPARLAQKDTLYGKTLLTGASNGRGGSVTSTLDKGFTNGLGLRVQGTYKRFGDFESPDFLLTNTGAEQKSVSLNLGINKFTYGAEIYYSYFNTSLGILSAANFGNITDLVRAINASEPDDTDEFSFEIAPPRQEVAHHLFKVKSFVRVKGLGKIALQYAYQFNDRQEFDNRRGENDAIPTVDLELLTHTLDLNFDIDRLNKLKITTGANGLYQENFANPLTGVRRVIPDYEKFNLGAFAGLIYTFNNDLELDFGGRVDFTRIDAEKFYRTSFFESRNYDVDFANIITQDFGTQLLTNPVFNYTNFSTTLGLSWQLGEKTNLLFNYGLASRAPNPSELFSEGLNQSSAAFELGDLRIDKETSNKFSLSLSSNLANNTLSFTITPYINLINDFIILEPTGVLATNRGTFQVFEYVQNNARLLGADIDLNYSITEHWKYTSSFSYLQGDDTARNRPLINIPSPNWFNTLSYNNPKWKNLNLSLKSELFFEQTRFPDNNFVAQTIVANEFVDVLVDVSSPPPGYHLLHFNSAIDLVQGPTHVQLGFGIDNLLNTRYRQYLNRFRFFADELGRNYKISLRIKY